MNGIINQDWEHEAQKDLVYLQEDMIAFYNSLNDPGKAQIEEFLSHKSEEVEPKIEVIDLTKKTQPVTIVVVGDKRILNNNESEVNSLPF